MSDRKAFLASVAGVAGALFAGADRASAQTASPSALPPAPSPSPSPVSPPSAAAMAAAGAMRAFDPALSDEEVATIARDIDDKRKRAKRLNPAKSKLRNSDEPVTAFRVEPPQ